MKKVLFVCTGNICRSPAAHGVLRDMMDEKLNGDVIVDSAATHAYHIGNPPDARMINCAGAHGCDLRDLKARKVSAADFEEFDLIIAMDGGHFEILREMKQRFSGHGKAEIKMFSDFIPKQSAFSGVRDVPDPYYGDLNEFEESFQMVKEGCAQIALFLKSSW